MLTTDSVPAMMLASTASGQRVNARTALQIADVYAAVRLLAETVGALPLHVFRRQGEERRRLRDGALVELLDRPSPAQTTSGLLGSVMVHLLTTGDAFIGLFRGPDGGVEQLAPLDPERMAVELRGGVLRYRYTQHPDATRGAQTVELTDADLVHVRALSRDGLTGMSVVEQAREALGISTSLDQFAARYFAEDCRPSGILRLGNGADDRLTALTDAWKGRHQGVDRSHRIAAVTGEVSFEAISASAEDAQLVEARQHATATIARVFRIPPSLLGAPVGDSMTYGNRESDMAHFVAHSIRPWTVAIEEAIGAHAELCPPGTFAEFSFDELLRADTGARYAAYETGLRAGFLEVDEVRRWENLPPLARATEPPPLAPAVPEPDPAPEPVAA